MDSKINALQKISEDLCVDIGINNSHWMKVVKYIGTSSHNSSSFVLELDEVDIHERNIAMNVAQMKSDQIMISEFGEKLRNETIPSDHLLLYYKAISESKYKKSTSKQNAKVMLMKWTECAFERRKYFFNSDTELVNDAKN